MDFHWIEVVGYSGTLATIAAYSMRTIIPLRIAGIFSSVFFIAYAAVMGVWPMLATELVILPLNCLRLYQILKLMHQIRNAPGGKYLPEWLDPFATNRNCKAGEIQFRRGDHADHLMLVQSGRFLLLENGMEIGPGMIVGELGFVAQDRKRAMTLKCIEAGSLGIVSYTDIKQLYFQNPQFGYFLLQLIGNRMADELKYEAELRAA